MYMQKNQFNNNKKDTPNTSNKIELKENFQRAIKLLNNSKEINLDRYSIAYLEKVHKGNKTLKEWESIFKSHK